MKRTVTKEVEVDRLVRSTVPFYGRSSNEAEYVT